MNNYYQYDPYYFERVHKNDLQQYKHSVLKKVEPLVQYGMQEASHTSYPHALREVAAITYLMGMGYEPHEARKIVESWEIDEMFYPGQRYEF